MPQAQRDRDFTLALHTSSAADIYLSCSSLDGGVWTLVKELDRAALGVVGDLGDLDHDAGRVRRIMRGCSGVLVVLGRPAADGAARTERVVQELRTAAELALPLAIVHDCDVPVTIEPGAGTFDLRLTDNDPVRLAQAPLSLRIVQGPKAGALDTAVRDGLERFLTACAKGPAPIRGYAFLIGRLERDFAHARAAIRAAVETEAGIPCLWADDGRHQTNVDSIRENTRLLIKHAAFVIADLTLGVESPERENPSRAHEIGMSIAYDRRLMLCSQEPRRYPYFSIGDMQMVFWGTEAELHACVREWIRPRRQLVARTVFNHQLEDVYADYDPTIGRPTFAYDAVRRYIGPNTSVANG